MALQSLDGTLGVLSEANIIATELGIDNWQIVQGSYNGCVFHVVQSIASRLNDTLNPAAGIIDSTTALIGASTEEPGISDNSNLPYGTSTTSTNILDMGRRKLVIHQLPNNEDVFEDLGWNGEIFIIQGIIFGAAYSQALNNILNVFLNDSKALANQRNVLIHPILGTIQSPTYLMAYKRIHAPNCWRSCMYEFVFRSAAPVSLLSNVTNTSVFNLNNAISSTLSIGTSLLNTWSTVTALQEALSTSSSNTLPTYTVNPNSFSNTGNSYTVQQYLATFQSAIQAAVNTSITTAQLMANNLQPAGYQNVALNQYPTTPTTEIPSYFYFISNMTPSDVNSIINNNSEVITATITTMQTINDNVIYDSISNLNALQAAIINLATILLNSYYGTIRQYTTPYDIDLISVCVLNNLDPTSQSNIIYMLNKALIDSANYIPKGTILTIPVSQNISGQVITQ
jgi:hypothetical protein